MPSRFFKSKAAKVSLKKENQEKPVPRELAEINKEYSEMLPKAGQSQYLVYVYTKELEEANRRLLSLNQEAKARQDLDAAANAKSVAETTNAAITKSQETEEVANEQV